ncbi:MAG: amidohydrolase [Bacillota bacterium]
MLAIINGDLHTVGCGRVPDGTVLTRGRHIVAVGTEVEVPKDARVIDAAGRPVTPGIVEAHAHVGINEQGVGWEGRDANESSDPITPEVDALDGINPRDDALREFREAGITFALVPPGSGNLIGGTAVAIKCCGGIADEMVIAHPVSMKAALGQNPKGSYGRRGKAPSTRMGNAALIREALDGAKEYLQARKKAEDEGKKPPKYDAKAEALIPVLNRQIPLQVHCHRADDIVTALRLCREYGLRFTLEHVTEGDRVVDLLLESDAHCAVGPTLKYGSKVENRDRSFRTPVELARAGVHFCLITDHPVIAGQFLPITAGIAVSWGMDYDTALRSITLSAAEHVGIEDRVGSLEVGKDADVVIWSGDPLDYTTFADYTIIDGEVVYEREA